MTAPETIAIPFEFDDDADFWQHPICKTYEANRNGVIRHILICLKIEKSCGL